MVLTTNNAISAAASIAASAVLIRTIAGDLLPSSLQDYLSSSLSDLFARLSSQLTISVDEFDGPFTNQLYKAAETYLATKLSPATRRLKATKQDDSDCLTIKIDRGEVITDHFEEIQFTWRLSCRETPPSNRRHRTRRHYMESTVSEVRSLELCFHKKHKEIAIKSYLPFILDRARAIREEERTLKLYTNEDDSWNAVNLRHPATFEILAMDGEVKRTVMEDLLRFVKRKDYYNRIGKAWKRGYLLYGPPGTGKSSLVAAMANLLRFDVYDLELTEVRSNSALRSLLVGTSNRSILVVEDIDCSLELPRNRANNQHDSDDDEEKVTLSGLLNCVDGLWSTCGEERIIVFTTNHRDQLDPALLRPGRMDMHIHMSYCSPSGFRVLARNYHSVDAHPLFEEIEGLMQEVEVTPAEVAEELMRSDDAEVVLLGLVKFLQGKKKKMTINREASEAEHNGS